MTLQPQCHDDIPEQTRHVAHLAFPQGNVYITMRDELGFLYQDEAFITLFRKDKGQGAISPGCLALVTVMQYSEGLSDRQAAQAVRSRIDWKYALGLELTDPGFDSSVLCEFRQRLLARGRERQLFDTLLESCQQQQWVKANGEVRTDSTHVFGAIRQFNRLELVGESLRQALNHLATTVPQWLSEQVSEAWFERYSERFEEYRWPDEKSKQQRLVQQIGEDGHQLLQAIYDSPTHRGLSIMPAVETLRQVWVQNYYLDGQGVHWRESQGLPPCDSRLVSPYDTEVRYRRKREFRWDGYMVQVSEQCSSDLPPLIVDIDTTSASTADATLTPQIQERLEARGIRPKTHYLDAGYISAENLVQAQHKGIEVVAPAPPDTSWQATCEEGFDITYFAIDWQQQQVQCPQGHLSRTWRPRTSSYGQRVIEVQFPRQTCRECPVRAQCTRSKTNPRALELKPQDQFMALNQAREQEKSESFRQRYARRAGIEGTISQAARSFQLRQCRYRGLAKTHLQQLLSATAQNITRLVRWLHGQPRATTRTSAFARLATKAA